MSISSSQNRVSYAGNGATTGFAVPFKFMQNADINAMLVNQTTFAETALVNGVDYTVSGADQAEGLGSITTTAAVATGTTIVIWCDPTVQQPLDLVDTDSLPTNGLNDEFDRLTIIARRALDLAKRAIRLPDDYSGSVTTAMPVGGIQPNMIPFIKADGTGFGMMAVPAMFSTMPQFASDAAFVAANGGATAGNTYWNTTSGVVRLYTGSVWLTMPMNGPTITGSTSAPIAITAAGGITLQGVPDETIFLKSAAGDLVLTANPVITHGVRVGDKIRLVWTDALHSITMNPGNGANPDGPWQALAGSSGQWLGWWDGTTWQQDGVT